MSSLSYSDFSRGTAAIKDGRALVHRAARQASKEWNGAVAKKASFPLPPLPFPSLPKPLPILNMLVSSAKLISLTFIPCAWLNFLLPTDLIVRCVTACSTQRRQRGANASRSQETKDLT